MAKDKKHVAPEIVHLSGPTLTQYLLSPKGEIEGLLLVDDEGLMQVVMQPDDGRRFLAFAPVGTELELWVQVRPSKDGAGEVEHRVFDLVEYEMPTDADEGVYGEWTTSGEITSLNYAKHGEVNGAILDNGDFVHLRPDASREAGLAVGQTLHARGDIRSHVLGGRVVEVTEYMVG
ncbi:MAG: hypothetical protein JWQ11_2028 [Rhizobacter sp.]|nr:hypothetical protein [Rhizobacter sp.]